MAALFRPARTKAINDGLALANLDRSNTMARSIAGLFAAAAFILLAPVRPAGAIEYPWCAQYTGGEMGGGRNCGFETLEQCRATVSGIGGDCQPNLFYTGPAPRELAKPHRERRND
jgi:hypothetical protein